MSPRHRTVNWQAPAVVVGEARRAVQTQPVTSVLTVVVAAAMVGAIILTNGRAVGSQRQAIKSLDSVTARTITVQVDPSVGLNAETLLKLRGMAGIEWAAAFGPVTDTHNGLIPDGQRVGERTIWTLQPQKIGLNVSQKSGLQVTRPALDVWGLTSVAGFVASDDDSLEFDVVHRLPQTGFMSSLEPVAVRFSSKFEKDSTVALVIIVVGSATYLAPVRTAVQSFLPTTDPQKVRINSDATAAQLQKQVGDQFASLGIGLVLTILATSSGLLSILNSGLVMLKRRDYGRRRALGASRGWVLSLILWQCLICCATGAVVGLVVAFLLLTRSGDPVPRPSYFLAVVLMSLIVAALSSLAPGLLAASRDPIRELRVP